MDEPTQLGDLPDDAHTRALRSVLRTEADQVQPSDRFAEIWAQARGDEAVDERTRGTTFRGLAAVAVAVMALGVSVPLILPRLVSPEAADDPTPVPTVSSTSQAPTGPPSVPTVNRDIAVYYIDGRGGLVREFRDLPTQNDRITTAVAAVLNVAPLDPAYKSSWSGGQVNSVKVSGNRITLDLSKSAFSGMTGRDQVIFAMRQIVYTATAAVGDRNGQKTVQVLVDGSPNLPHLGAPSSDFTREGVEPLADIVVDSPQYGDTVTQPIIVRGAFKTEISKNTKGLSWGVAPAGKVPTDWTKVELQKPAAGWDSFRIELPDLEPGSYAVHVKMTDPTDGSQQVVKVFTVS